MKIKDSPTLASLGIDPRLLSNKTRAMLPAFLGIKTDTGSSILETPSRKQLQLWRLRAEERIGRSFS